MGSAVYPIDAGGSVVAATSAVSLPQIRRSVRSSFSARDVETQEHLDDRALPDRLRSLHRHLHRH